MVPGGGVVDLAADPQGIADPGTGAGACETTPPRECLQRHQRPWESWDEVGAGVLAVRIHEQRVGLGDAPAAAEASEQGADLSPGEDEQADTLDLLRLVVLAVAADEVVGALAIVISEQSSEPACARHAGVHGDVHALRADREHSCLGAVGPGHDDLGMRIAHRPASGEREDLPGPGAAAVAVDVEHQR